MPTTLVTGATGFVGSHVARALVARGDDVCVTVRATSNLDALAGLDVRTTIADLTDRRAVRRALKDVSRVFHVAGSTNLPAPGGAPFEGHGGAAPGGLGGGPRAGGRRRGPTPPAPPHRP